MRARWVRAAVAAAVAVVGVTLGIAPDAAMATGLATPSASRTSAAPTPPPTPGSPPSTTAKPPSAEFARRAHKRSCADPAPKHVACLSETVDGIAQPSVTAATAPPGYAPADLRSAYSLPATGGSGATVAVVDAYDSPTAESDLATYRAQYGLPACTTANGCFRKVDQRGGTSYPGVDPSHGWAVETSIDLDMVSAACPACHILLVETDDSNLDNMGAAVNTAVTLGAQYVSNSYGSQAGAGMDFSPWDSYYNHPGVVVTASSGDAGYDQGYPQFPASSRYVTAVGGTSLTPSSGTARGWSESAWSGAGSGCSTYSPKPSWQSDTGCGARTVADVSAVADPSTGVAGFAPTDTAPYTSAWQVFGGTSVSSPLIAAMYALAGTPAPGSYPASYPYASRSALNDVTSGSTGSCSPAYLCTAGSGYDGPTGLGSPRGVAALAAPQSGPIPPALGDFNSDGHADVLSRDSGGFLYLYRGNGSGGWLSPPGVQVGSGWNGMTAMVSPGDFDGDGHNDVLARDSAGTLWLYPGNGASGWGTPRQVGSGWNIMTKIIAARDFNGDGHPDLLAVDGSGVLWLYPGDGHGSWLARQAIGSGWSGMSAIVGIRDFTGDKSPGLLARDSSGRLWLYERTPTGWKAPIVVGSGWNIMTAIASVGDFNGDGHDDILARTSAGALIMYPTTGRTGWGNPIQVGSGWNTMSWIG